MESSITRRTIALLCIVNLVMLPLQQALAATITKEFYHYNHQGSPIGVYDGKGNELLIQRWTPWGERQVLKTSAPGISTGALLKHGLPAHMGYTGHKDLVAADLVFMGDTRLYSARHKRFLNPDDRTTGGIRGENRFSYAYNNPIANVDPSGHAPVRSYLASALGIALEIASSPQDGGPPASQYLGGVGVEGEPTVAVVGNGFSIDAADRTSNYGPSLDLPISSIQDASAAAGLLATMMSAALPNLEYKRGEGVLSAMVTMFGAFATTAGFAFGELGGAGVAVGAAVVGAAAILNAAAIRNFAGYINGGNPLMGPYGALRNALYVSGNLIGALPAMAYAWRHNGAGDAAITAAAVTVLSLSIFTADRLWIVGGNQYSLRSARDRYTQHLDTNRLGRDYDRVVLKYTGTVLLGGFAGSVIKSKLDHSSGGWVLHSATAVSAAIYPATFKFHRGSMERSANGGLNEIAFRSRYIYAAVPTFIGSLVTSAAMGGAIAAGL